MAFTRGLSLIECAQGQAFIIRGFRQRPLGCNKIRLQRAQFFANSFLGLCGTFSRIAQGCQLLFKLDQAVGGFQSCCFGGTFAAR